MAAVLVEILSTGEQPVDRTLRLVAASKDADGLASDSVGLTAAVRDPVAGKWWNGDGLVWQDARHEHDMTEDVPGLYSLALATTSMVPSGELDVVVVVSSTDSPDAVALLPLRHGLRSLPLSDEVAPAPLTKLSHLLNLLGAYYGGSQEVSDVLKRLVVYQSDGETPAAEWDLRDAAGNPSAMERFRQVRRP